MYDRKINLSVVSMDLSENSKPKIAIDGDLPVIDLYCIVTDCLPYFCRESMSFCRFSCMASPGATFCLHTRKAECRTAYRQCRLRAAGTHIQSPATCISGRHANIRAYSPGKSGASPWMRRHRSCNPSTTSAPAVRAMDRSNQLQSENSSG